MTLKKAYREVFDKLHEHSVINEEEVAKILGYDDIEGYRKHMNAPDTELSEETKYRTENLLKIILGLQGLFNDYGVVRKWLRIERDFSKLDKNFQKHAPLELLCDGSLESMELVKELSFNDRELR